MQKLVMESIGTMFLVLAVGLTGNPLAIGLMLMVMVYMGGHVSGAHYNPAVSLAVFLRGKLTSAEMLRYWGAQLLGAFVAAILHWLLKDATFAPAPGADVALWQALLAEILFTFALASVVLNVATTKTLAGNWIYGAAIGLTVTAAAFSVGGISGGAFNPAVATGPIVWQGIQGGSGWSDLVLYWVGPLVGGALAAVVFKYLQPEEVS
jgi:aquaporin Z